MSKIKLALLSGGISPERDISLKTGAKIYEALDKEKYEIFRYDPKDELTKFIIDASTGKFDIVLPALHGAYGEDGRLQGLLDMIGLPYLFSGVFASALAINKHKCKMIVSNAGIMTAKDVVLRKGQKYEEKSIVMELGLPLIVKPAELGSSVGINLVHDIKELKTAIDFAFKHDSKVLIEEYIKGREFTVAVIGNTLPEALPVIEIIPKDSVWFDHRAKYEEGGAEEICPAVIPDKLKDELQKASTLIYTELHCKDLARADFIWSSENSQIYFIEINTIPGMTETSLVPKAARAEGMQFGDFLNRLIDDALKFYKVNSAQDQE